MASSSAPPSGVWSRGGRASGAAVRGLGGLRRVGLGILTLAALLSLPAAAPAQIPVELRFDGQPIDTQAPPDFSCFDHTRGRWTACRVERVPGPGAFVLQRLDPGNYRMHVSVDENRANPRRHPGDYEVQLVFEVTATGPDRLTVDLARLIHLTLPGDNGRPLEGMLTSCVTQPTFVTPRHSWGPRATVDFAWEPLVAGAEYRYRLVARACGQPGADREIVSAATGDTAVRLALSPNADGEQYVFRVEAWKGGRLVGDLYTHDGGAHSWNYRFRVHNKSLPRWAYFATATGVALALLGAYRLVGVDDPARRRRRVRLLLGGAIIGLALGAAGGVAYQYHQSLERQRDEAARAAAEAARQARHHEFVDAFGAAAPRPDWWDRMETSYRVENVGDLLAAWQGHPRGEPGERQFFKAAYQGIVDHPDDEHVAATAIMLLDYVARDYPHRLGLARFGYERYFSHRSRTDNCVNCMTGDTTQGLVLNLSRIYMSAGRHDEAIAVCQRLIDERSAEVSPYKLAETWNQMAWAYWHRGDRDRAIQIARGALGRYDHTVLADELRRTLATFERER
jgi:tetratricopeptide (TPR) repeat protein